MSDPGPSLQSATLPEQADAGAPTQGLGVVAVSFAVAAWSGMCGIGGGLFAVPLLHFVYKMKLKEAIPISLSLVAAATISGTVTEALRADSAINWGIVLGLVAGSLVGAPVGFRVAQRVNSRILKQIFVVLLVFVGTRILGFVPQAFAAGPNGLPVNTVGLPEYAISVLIGFGGGFVSPLLGIGGGLIAVPALLFGVPAIGYYGARACSLAMATVTSTRSLALYWRAGSLDLRRSLSVALGAALGAWLGVYLVHIDGVKDIAQKMLGVTLLLVAVRFLFDLRRKPAGG
jgi:uncharacterized membrane protein YfcA